jgi:hypothetical protein
MYILPDHLSLDRAPNLGPLISRWEINKFENCCYKSVRISEVLKLLFQQFLNLSSSQKDMSGPIVGDLSNNRWSGVARIYSIWIQNYLWSDIRASGLADGSLGPAAVAPQQIISCTTVRNCWVSISFRRSCGIYTQALRKCKVLLLLLYNYGVMMRTGAFIITSAAVILWGNDPTYFHFQLRID